MPLSWKESYLTGQTDIDLQHQMLFDVTARLVAARSPEMQALCAKSLYDDTRDHFEHEERLMNDTGYPELSTHRKLHQSLLRRLDEITHEIADHSLNLNKLESFITDWLITHIITADAAMANHIELALH